MENLREWWGSFENSVSESLVEIWAYLPTLIAAVAVLLVGWLVGRLARTAVLRSHTIVGRLFGRFGGGVQAGKKRISQRILAVTGSIVFWVTLLVFAAAAAQVAGFDAFTAWLDRMLGFLPNLIAGLLIVVAGFLFSTLVRDVVTATWTSIGAEGNELAGLTAQSIVFVSALVIGLDQIGMDVTFLIAVGSVLVGGVLLSIALAFGLGAQDFVSNVIAARQLRVDLKIGDYARCGNVEGRILEITKTNVILVNDQGRALIPASRLQQSSSEIVLEDSHE